MDGEVIGKNKEDHLAESILNALLFKSKPVLPELDKIDIGTEQQKAITNNLAAQPAAQKLAAGENTFNFDQLTAMLEKAIPFYQQLKQQGSANILSLLKGQIPDDVAAQIQNRVAAKGIEQGYGGSGFAGNTQRGTLLARDLGITSLALIDKGISATESWFASAANNAIPRLADASSMFISPQQQLAADVTERNTQWNFNWFKNQFAVQPEPWERAVGGLLDWVATTGESVASTYAGNIGGGAGGGGMMGGGGGGGGGGTSSGAGYGFDYSGSSWK